MVQQTCILKHSLSDASSEANRVYSLINYKLDIRTIENFTYTI